MFLKRLEPSSELHIADTRYRRTAPDDLPGVATEQVHTRRLYEGLDALPPQKEAVRAVSGRSGLA